MKTLHLLYLGGRLSSELLAEVAMQLISVIAETRYDEEGIVEARVADQYDAVLIFEDDGKALQYAQEIPMSMRPRTLIVTDSYSLDRHFNYIGLGFGVIGKPSHAPKWLTDQAKQAA